MLLSVATCRTSPPPASGRAALSHSGCTHARKVSGSAAVWIKNSDAAKQMAQLSHGKQGNPFLTPPQSRHRLHPLPLLCTITYLDPLQQLTL